MLLRSLTRLCLLSGNTCLLKNAISAFRYFIDIIFGSHGNSVGYPNLGHRSTSACVRLTSLGCGQLLCMLLLCSVTVLVSAAKVSKFATSFH
jgi:hypothetical protein